MPVKHDSLFLYKCHPPSVGCHDVRQTFQPVYLDEFIADEDKRLLYWQRKKAMWKGIREAAPGKTHYFFKKLFDKDKLLLFK